MGSLVLELQRECLDSRTSVADILRKALVVARKLGVLEFEKWIGRELNGYEDSTSLPSYRRLQGVLHAWDPWRNGFIPFMIKDPEFAEVASKCSIMQGVGELEDIARATAGGSGAIEFPFSPQQMQVFKLEEGYRPTRHLTRTSIIGIIDAVRNAVLNWTLKLEQDGIMGESMTFDAVERRKAVEANYTTNNFFGPVRNSQIQQAGSGSAQSICVRPMDLGLVVDAVRELKSQIERLKLDPSEASQLRADIQAVETQLSSPRPNRIVIRELMGSVRNILEGCAGSLVASDLLQRLAIL